jgi:hypothetical protein
MGHWLHAAEEVTGGILSAEDFAAFDRKLKQDFAGLTGEELADLVWRESGQDFDAI